MRRIFRRTPPAATEPAGAPVAPVVASGRIASFDGLRGVAAFVVILYHYMCLLHPTLAPTMASVEAPVVDTPLYLFLNGAFAVALFFVLSGFVIARTSDRRRNALAPTIVARYLRLAVPACASCVFAWMLLSTMPTAAETLAEHADRPSRWHDYTYQGDLNSPMRAAYNGLFGIFHYGYSRWNNVLWTLQIELFGSIGIFLLYVLGPGRVRLALLAAGTVIMPVLTEPSYAAFGLGAALYEGWRASALQRLKARLGDMAPVLTAIILALGLLLGFPGDGFHARAGLPDVPPEWQLGASRGYVHGIAAALVVTGVLLTPPLSKVLSLPPFLWLGQVSFGLYLVHVPILYTLVAALYLQWEIPSPVLMPLFIGTSLLFAQVFTRLVDEPSLRLSAQIRGLTTLGRRRVPC